MIASAPLFFKKFSFLLFCALAFTFITQAQSALSKTFLLEEDNKQIQVNVLFKNHQGYLYAGTTQGLYKFDGVRFYRIHFTNKEYSDTVTAIFQDTYHALWIGFRSGRIANVIDGRLVYFNPEEGSPQKKITAFLQDKEGKIWFATNGEGIYYLKHKRLYLVNKENGLTDENVSALALTNNGDILAATDQGVNCIHLKEKNRITSIGPREGLPDYIVTTITIAASNQFWIGMQDKGYCLYDHTTGKITIPNHDWNQGQVNVILQAQNYLWIATQESGLIKVKLPVRDNAFLQQATPHTINSMLEDNQGNIWLAGTGTGLIRTTGESVKLFPLPAGTVFEHIHSLLADTKGRLWVTNSKNELIRYSPGSVKNNSVKIKLEGITEKTDITAFYQDMHDNIWIGTMGKGIYILDPHTSQYRIFKENPLFNNASILSITGKGETVFASSLQGSMAINLNKSNKDIRARYNFNNYDQAGMGSNYIYTIFKDSKGRTWFATDGKGISVLQNGRFTNYDDTEKIKDDRVYSIAEDRFGNIWFSTASAGVYKFDGTNFRNYSLKEGLSDLNISALKTDKKGNISIIHKKGIDILEPSTNNIAYLNNNTGIGKLNVEDLGAVTQDAAGNIYVSSENGIVLYSPEIKIVQQPKTIIESVQLFLNTLQDSSSRNFHYEDNSFTFNYTSLYYSDPEQIYYQYKLEGFDTSWILTKDRSKTFPKLAPGKYTFRIQSALNKNFLHADEASWSFVIKPAFYKTWWFILLCIIISGSLLYWYIKNREISLKKLERLQQEKIQFRFEVLRNQVNPHFLFNSFNTLISTIEDDPKMAVEYVEQLSDFFRNIVNYRDKDVISLKEELELLYTYFFLQQKRYGQNLQLSVNLSDTEKMNSFIPPLTLQLLMENAIKHNAITKDNHLIVTLDINGDYLNIKNNINVRLSTESGTGMGLQNIINRYHLLTTKEVKVSKTEYFIVSLPLIQNHHA